MATLTKRTSPLADLADLRERFDRMVEDLFDGDRLGRQQLPAIDVIQEDDAIVMKVDVPGVKPEDIKVEVEDDILTVQGSHEETKEEKDKRYLRRERRYGSFARSMVLPPGVDTDAIKATAENGVLHVRIPKPEKAEPKAIAIESANSK